MLVPWNLQTFKTQFRNSPLLTNAADTDEAGLISEWEYGQLGMPNCFDNGGSFADNIYYVANTLTAHNYICTLSALRNRGAGLTKKVKDLLEMELQNAPIKDPLQHELSSTSYGLRIRSLMYQKFGVVQQLDKNPQLSIYGRTP